MDAIENIALIIFLLALGVGLTVAVLIGFIYVVEFMND
jgi:Na+-transporting methylmalonyl-CoA/oxaloacetate decarboxylase gamma subunit